MRKKVGNFAPAGSGSGSWRVGGLASSAAIPGHTLVPGYAVSLLQAERTTARDIPVAMRNRSANWRKLAEEAKAIAARMQDAVSKQTMLEIAERYELLARYVDQRAKDEDDAKD